METMCFIVKIIFLVSLGMFMFRAIKSLKIIFSNLNKLDCSINFLNEENRKLNKEIEHLNQTIVDERIKLDGVRANLMFLQTQCIEKFKEIEDSFCQQKIVNSDLKQYAEKIRNDFDTAVSFYRDYFTQLQHEDMRCLRRIEVLEKGGDFSRIDRLKELIDSHDELIISKQRQFEKRLKKLEPKPTKLRKTKKAKSGLMTTEELDLTSLKNIIYNQK